MNVPRPIATVISHNRATLIELQTVYGSKDLYDLLEIIIVDQCNDATIKKASQG